MPGVRCQWIYFRLTPDTRNLTTREWLKQKSMRVVSTVTVKGIGITGEKVLRATARGQLLDEMTIAGIGRFRQGSTGTLRWS